MFRISCLLRIPPFSAASLSPSRWVPLTLTVEDEQLNPLVTVTEGTRAVQSRIQISWLVDSSLTHVKTILSDMHRMANNN
jgi:hypothetical protein